MIDPYTDRRLKIIENRISVLENIVDSIKTTNEYKLKSIEEKLNTLISNINNLKQEIDNLKLKLKAIQDQMSLFAPIERVKALERYIDIIDPFSYLTKKEAERLIEKKLKEILDSNGHKVKVYKEDRTY